MFNKTFLPFYVIAGLFAIMSIFLITVYTYEPVTEDTSEQASVEVNLPVIQLDQYLNLSKSLE